MDAYFLKEKSLGRPEVRILFVLKWAVAEWFNAILRNLFGGLVEWSIAPVLKTGGRDERSIGSNPIASAIFGDVTLICARALS